MAYFNLSTWSVWAFALVAYLILIVASLTHVFLAFAFRKKRNEGGPSFDDSEYWKAHKSRLIQHWQRIEGTLDFWKSRAHRYKVAHLHCLWWLMILTLLLPILTQIIDSQDGASKFLITLITLHIAAITAITKTFKLEQNYQAFRSGESEFYDIYRRLLDNPRDFGKTHDEQISTYFQNAELIRQKIRKAETDNAPSLEILKLHTSNDK